MTEVLFIKTSSLGDVVHHLPAITEAARRRPDARFSWVVEAPYAPLVARHRAVARIIPVATRVWRRSLFSPGTWRGAGAFVAALRDTRYDVVVDTQGLLRSAAIARLARGPRHGYDRASIREPFASMAYDHRHRVARDRHAVARNRALTALALGYEPEGPPDFGLARADFAAPPARPDAVLLHATARPEKLWPLEYWRSLATTLSGRGYRIVLPSGTDAELERSRQLAAAVGEAQILDRAPLDVVAPAIAGASLAVGVDTGLLHLAAALGVPLVAIFVGASRPALTGPVGSGPMATVDGLAPPSPNQVLAAIEQLA